MSTFKKTPIDELARIKLAAAKFRAEYVAKARPIEGEIRPVNGIIHATVGGAVLPLERIEEIFGPSSTELPEFKLEREKLLKQRQN